MKYKDKNYHYYCIARNKAWEIISECNIRTLPIDLIQIVNYFDIKIIPYSRSVYVTTSDEKIQNGDGFSRIENGENFIYFNDKKATKARRRFTIAHELGHCLLGHDLSKTKYRNSETGSNDDPIEEIQANVFARDILMPAIVLHHTGCIKYTDIMRLCDVSETSAQLREERMKVIEVRNKFCTSPLEKQVYDNFSNFIKAYKK